MMRLEGDDGLMKKGMMKPFKRQRLHAIRDFPVEFKDLPPLVPSKPADSSVHVEEPEEHYSFKTGIRVISKSSTDLVAADGTEKRDPIIRQIENSEDDDYDTCQSSESLDEEEEDHDDLDYGFCCVLDEPKESWGTTMIMKVQKGNHKRRYVVAAIGDNPVAFIHEKSSVAC